MKAFFFPFFFSCLWCLFIMEPSLRFSFPYFSCYEISHFPAQLLCQHSLHISARGTRLRGSPFVLVAVGMKDKRAFGRFHNDLQPTPVGVERKRSAPSHASHLSTAHTHVPGLLSVPALRTLHTLCSLTGP